MLVDTNVLVRHLTGEPADQAQRATAFLASGEQLEMPALIAAELVYVLESVYDQSRSQVAVLLRSVLAYPAIETGEERAVRHAVELYETTPVHFAEAYLAALAKAGDGEVASFDRGLDRLATVRRVEP